MLPPDSVRKTLAALYGSDDRFQLGETDDNGVPIDGYQLRVWQGALDVTPALRDAPPVFAVGFGGTELSFEVDAASVALAPKGSVVHSVTAARTSARFRLRSSMASTSRSGGSSSSSLLCAADVFSM